MADAPDGIVLRRHRDLRGRRWHPWARRSLVALTLAVAVLGLLNLFGQRPATSTVSADTARLEVYSPARVRGGLIFEARFTIDARREIEDAILVLGSGWLEGMTVNTVEPSPIGEASRDGDLSLDLGHIPAGEKYVLFVQFQVNPTNVGRRTRRADLYDGEEHLLTYEKTMTVFP